MNKHSSHSASFIKQMQEKLTDEQKSLESELATIDRPEYGRTEEENAAEVADFEAASSTKDTLKERHESVIEALQRIEDGSYGVTASGELIPEDRLRANPAATTLVVKK